MLYGVASEFTIETIVKAIHRGEMFVPEFISKEFTWGEQEVLNLLDNIFSYKYRVTFWVISPKFNRIRLQDGSFKWEYEWEIPLNKFFLHIPPNTVNRHFHKYDSKRTPRDIFYIIDGYKQIQSLYLAWFGSLNGRHVYFDTGALGGSPFLFSEPGNASSLCERLNNVKNVDAPQSDIIFMNQPYKNCTRFKSSFTGPIRRTLMNIVDMNDPFYDEQLLVSMDNNPQKKKIMDRIKFIKESYINVAANQP